MSGSWRPAGERTLLGRFQPLSDIYGFSIKAGAEARDLAGRRAASERSRAPAHTDDVTLSKGTPADGAA